MPPYPLAVALFLAAAAEPDLVRFVGLDPGPHAVGHRALGLRDPARPWPSAADPSGSRGRPVDVALWFPIAGAAGEPLAARDYLEIGQPGAAGLAAARARYDQGREPLSDEDWRRVAALPTLARRASSPAPPLRPLVLLSAALQARPDLHAALGEWLASHGFIAAALGSAGSREGEPLAFDADGVEAQVADHRFALGALRELASLGFDGVALVGWSFGGVAQAVLRQREPGAFRAAVSFDSGSGYDYGGALLEQLDALDPKRLREPFLQVDATRASRVPRDERLFLAHPARLRQRVSFPGLHHGDLVLPGLLRSALRPGPEAAEVRAQFRTAAERLRAFLAAHTGRTEPTLER